MHSAPLGRRHAPDNRDKNHLMATVLDPFRNKFFPRGLPPGTRHYVPGHVLDQGNTGTCVGHGWAGFLQGAPLMTKPVDETQPFAIYDACIKIDEFSDNDVDPDRQYGTSVRAGAKVLQSLGYIKQYVWAQNSEDLRAWHLAGFGTCVLGINWYTSMFTPDKDGFLDISGIIEGGHCIKTTGWSDKHDAVYIQNSWGTSWGVKGRARIKRSVLDRLLSEDGEACAAIEQKRV